MVFPVSYSIILKCVVAASGIFPDAVFVEVGSEEVKCEIVKSKDRDIEVSYRFKGEQGFDYISISLVSYVIRKWREVAPLTFSLCRE